MLLTRFRIIGHSMEPQIKSGETVLVSGIPYWFKTPKINDIVAFKDKKKVLIKRIVRITGDKYFVAGDNKKDSLDSRDFGFISRKQISGKVFYK
jgi:signal peptidase I